MKNGAIYLIGMMLHASSIVALFFDESLAYLLLALGVCCYLFASEIKIDE